MKILIALFAGVFAFQARAAELCGTISQKFGTPGDASTLRLVISISPSQGAPFEVVLKAANTRIGLQLLGVSNTKSQRACVEGNYESRDVFEVNDLKEDSSPRFPKGPVPIR